MVADGSRHYHAFKCVTGPLECPLCKAFINSMRLPNLLLQACILCLIQGADGTATMKWMKRGIQFAPLPSNHQPTGLLNCYHWNRLVILSVGKMQDAILTKLVTFHFWPCFGVCRILQCWQILEGAILIHFCNVLFLSRLQDSLKLMSPANVNYSCHRGWGYYLWLMSLCCTEFPTGHCFVEAVLYSASLSSLVLAFGKFSSSSPCNVYFAKNLLVRILSATSGTYHSHVPGCILAHVMWRTHRLFD